MDKDLIVTAAIGARVFQGLNLVLKSLDFTPTTVQDWQTVLFVSVLDCHLLGRYSWCMSVIGGESGGQRWSIAQAVMSVQIVEIDRARVVRMSAFSFKHRTPG
jgi:hypothetical protein